MSRLPPAASETSPGAAPPWNPLRTRLFVALQHALPQHALSRVVHALARIRSTPVKNGLIGAFVSHFRPDMADAVETDPLRYESFNAFFTRALTARARPIAHEASAVVSPVDGTVSQIGYLTDLSILQAKGRDYSLEALLCGHSDWTRRLAGGAFATLYLAPYNYHRIHMPLAAALRASWYVPGSLFSVNAATAGSVPNLFARNERVVCAFEEDLSGEAPLCFAMVLVGALFVGSIATRWHGDITPRSPRRPVELPAEGDGLRLDRGAEMGRFNMGSTVILLFPRDTVEWLPGLAAGSRIRMGEPIAVLRAPS
jgi:phosphatidylserine decarboxylase